MTDRGDGAPAPSVASARARMRDVAQAARVDQSIVSRVLRNDPHLKIRPETRERVLRAAAELNYRPNAAARSLRTARTMMIGMVVPDLANVVYERIARGVSERAVPAGYVVMVAAGSAGMQLGEIAGRVDGLLFGGATDEATAPGEVEDDGVPMVLVNRRERWGVPTATVDDQAGTALAARHLIALGHTRIAHIGGPHNADTGRRRLLGFRRAMEAASLEVPEEFVVEARYDEESGYAATARLLEASPRPSAIVASNLLGAVGAMAAVSAAGLRIPQDVSLVGFHDAALAAYLNPPLTTVRMPLEEMGRRAVDGLLALMRGESDVDDVEVREPPELVVRGSTAAPGASS
jgi:LacI family transcriptional regulator